MDFDEHVRWGPECGPRVSAPPLCRITCCLALGALKNARNLLKRSCSKRAGNKSEGPPRRLGMAWMKLLFRCIEREARIQEEECTG